MGRIIDDFEFEINGENTLIKYKLYDYYYYGIFKYDANNNDNYKCSSKETEDLKNIYKGINKS